MSESSDKQSVDEIHHNPGPQRKIDDLLGNWRHAAKEIMGFSPEIASPQKSTELKVPLSKMNNLHGVQKALIGLVSTQTTGKCIINWGQYVMQPSTYRLKTTRFRRIGPPVILDLYSSLRLTNHQLDRLRSL
jgi:hypothetical protein